MLVRFKDGEFAVVGPGDSIGHEKIVSLNHDGNVLWCANDHGVIGKLEHGTYLPVATNVAAVAASLKLVHREGGLGPTALSQVLDQRLQAGQLERLAGIAPGALRFAAPGRAGWWLGTESFLKALGESNQISLVDLPTNILSSTRVALEDRQGNLWLGTEQHGLWCRGNDGTMQAYSTTNGLGGDTVLCLFEDRQGAIWVGCEGGGLNRLRPRPFHVLPRSSAIWGEPATAVCEGRPGELWVGTEHNGLCRLANGLAQPVGLGQMPPIRRIRSLKFDSTQRLWVGTQEDGLFYFQDGVLGAFRSLLRVRQVSALFEDDRWGLWLGTGMANTIFRIVGDAPQRFSVPYSLPNLDVRVFADDGAGGLWFGTHGNGLFHWNGRDYAHYARGDGLGSDTIWSLLKDAADQSLWIGTAGGGLSRFKAGRLQTCTTQEGLYDDVICQILDDGRGWLWCSSQRGIFRVSKAALGEFFDGGKTWVLSVPYGLGDGLPSLECAGGSQPAGCRSSDGKLWWPTAKGLVWVAPDEMPADAEPPTVLLDELLVDDKPVSYSRGSGTASRMADTTIPVAEVGPGTRRIEIHFTALSWAAPEFVRFRHRLDGFDQDWVETGRNREVHYTGLPPKQYHFQVIAANRDGIWNSIGAGMLVRIQPYSWQTWWFKLGSALALSGGAGILIAWMVHRRHQVRLQRLERQHAVEQERARIAQDIHDDLGASLTQIALLSELAQRQIGEPQAARGHLDLIFKSARTLARATDEIVWALHPKNNDVELTLGFITRFAQEYLRVAGVACRLELPDELPAAEMPSTTRHHLYLAVKEALNNVVKHAGATEVWLRLKCGEDTLSLTVEDNGRGFDQAGFAAKADWHSPSRRGNGLQGMEKRMRAVDGTFEQISRVGSGTVTRFTVALQK